MVLSASTLDLNWYEWELQCQKMYLILITNANKPIKVSVITIIDIDFELLKKVNYITY